MNEFELISLLTRDLPAHPSVVIGPGDDCAVIDLGIPDRFVVFKTDATAEGIHFQRDAAPEKVGHKALGRVLSDFAAMAARPTAVLVTLALPDGYDPAWAQGLYRGLQALAGRWDTAIVGGETTTNPERIFISISAIGTVDRQRVIGRTGSKPGDALFVSGELGGSLEGRHLEFEPRLEEAEWLATHFTVHAMIDLSDGLAGDVRHLLERGQIGAEIHSASIPISRVARLRARRGNGARSALLAALTDGEDFELLFTVAGRDAVPVLDQWKDRFPGVRLTCIGRITENPGLRLRTAKGVRDVEEHGFTHFA